MTEPLPDLPGRLPEPSFRPTDGRYDAARAAAGRRRRRQVALSGGGATLAAVLLTGAALLGGPSGPQVLDDATPPGSVVAEQTPEPSAAPSPEPTPTEGPQAAPTDDPAASATPGTAPTDDPSSEPGAVEDPDPTASPDAPASLVRGPEPTVTTYDSSRVCDGSGPTAPSGWCSYYDGDRTAPRGGTAELAAAVCRLPGQGTGTLRADDGEYALFYVGTELGARWNWGTGQRFAPEPRDFTVEPGTCLRLAVTWDLAGDDGRPLPPGDYDADARPALSPGNGASVNTQLVFTIT